MSKKESSAAAPSRYRRLAARCDGCGAEVELLTAFDAAALSGVTSYTIYRWAEGGVIHSRVTPEGVLFVCPHSLAQTQRPRAVE